VRVAVVGAGAIGGFIAAALARSGTAVAAVARGEHLAAMRAHGVRVEGDAGSFRVPIEAGDDLRMLGRFDALLLTFKAHQWRELLPQLEPFSAGGGTIVTLQNGVPFWFVREPPLRSVDPGGRIGRLFSDDRIVGGVVHVSGRLSAPGAVIQSGGLRYVFGAPNGGTNDRTDRVIALFSQAGLSPEADASVRSTIWLKLVNNAGLNPVSALRRLTIKQLLADREARAEVRTLMCEALSVGQAIGVVRDVDVDARIEYAARLDDVKTSMLQDYERGRELELDPILGAVIELGHRYGVPVPQMQRAYDSLQPAAKKH
jgi:2-dehydropantoate 2-reductase